MNNYDWPDTFRKIYDQAVKNYRAGSRTAASLFNATEIAFLASIGCTAQELFDFVEDGSRGGDPTYDTVLLITAVRRDYFLTVQHGKLSTTVIDMDDLPPKSAELGGIAWLPRIIEKAKAKLRGEMPPDLMYGCGGDRPFLRGKNIHLADFLRYVWATDGDPKKVLEYVKRQSGAK